MTNSMSHRSDVATLFLVVLVRGLDGTGRVVRRVQHGTLTRFHPLLEFVAADAMVLHCQQARDGPLPVLGEADLAGEGVELVGGHGMGGLRLVEPACRLDRLLE